MSTKINLGDKVKDAVTGFTGIAVARTTWLHGCDRIAVQPEGMNKEGKPFENFSFDELQLVIIKRGVVPNAEKVAEKIVEPKVTRMTGGPRDDKAALRRN